MEYARRAVELLEAAVERGGRNLKDLKESGYSDPLRSREDFQRLIEELEAR